MPHGDFADFVYRTPDHANFSSHIHFAIRLRQTSVANHQCYGFGAELDWSSHAPAVDELAHITTLQIYAGPGFENEQASWIYHRAPALRNLEIECDCDYEDSCCKHDQNHLKQIFG